ncbi:Ctf8p and Ctf18p associating protein [Coemansia sp. RSA 2704]|nr:Ctf8p and Ctf18p associating protein [Coemansia sp. RSA 2704]
MSDNGTFELSASDGYPEEYRLMELPADVAAALIGGQPLEVRGRETDTAVLIAGDATYQLHTAHTSNSLYLFEQHGHRLELCTKLHQMFELQSTRPQIRARVSEVLAQDARGPFRGVEFEQPGDGVDDTELRRQVQAGDRQLYRVLAEMPAFRDTATGFWRMMDPVYCIELLRLILATQVEQDWELDALDAERVHTALAAESPQLREAVEAVLHRFGASTRPGVFAMDPQRVARFLAKQIFATEGTRAWPVSEFLQALQATMPPQLLLDEHTNAWGSRRISRSLVRGLAIATTTPENDHLVYSAQGVPGALTLLLPIDASDLPQDVRARMRRLFEIKSRWSREELIPFLEELVDVDDALLGQGDEQTDAAVAKAVDTWLIKFGRGVKTPDGETVYTSRIN